MSYQWTETQVVNLKGEDKSAKQFSCSYGPDGKVVKTALTAPAPGKDKPGLRGKIVENKKEEMSGYMKSAVALVKSYIPPDPAKIQAAKDAGQGVDDAAPGREEHPCRHQGLREAGRCAGD
jgi:hypothetical protein